MRRPYPPTCATLGQLRRWVEGDPRAELRLLPVKPGNSPALEILYDGEKTGNRLSTIMFYGKYEKYPKRWGWGSTFPVDFMARAMNTMHKAENGS